MKQLPLNKLVNTKWLTKELQAANVRVHTVAQNEGETVGYAEIEEADEALALSVIEAHDANNNEGTVIAAAPVGAKAWFDSRPNAKLLFSLSVADLEAEIFSLVDTSFPALSAGNRMRWKLLLMAVAIAVRVLVKRERLG